MPLPRPLPAFRTRHVLALAVVFAQLAAATGTPVFTTPKRSAGVSVPFPCQNHSCGCLTSEQGWAGDCCCFTLEQKLAWADARGIEPPAHVRPAVAARKAKPDCCSKARAASCCAADEDAKPECAAGPSPRLKMVVSLFAQKCRGEGPAGASESDAGFVPPAPAALPSPRAAGGFVRAPDVRPALISLSPPKPPPRSS